MASWVLQCQHCSRVFTQSQIREKKLIDYFVPLKPELPPEGLELECPHCKAKSIYLPNDLRYEKA